MEKQIIISCKWGDGIWHFYRISSLTGLRPGRWATHTLTCFRDERVQALRVPELVTPAGAALLQPILLGRGRHTTRGSPASLSLLRTLSLKHTAGVNSTDAGEMLMMQSQECVLKHYINQNLAWRSKMADIQDQFGYTGLSLLKWVKLKWLVDLSCMFWSLYISYTVILKWNTRLVLYIHAENKAKH